MASEQLMKKILMLIPCYNEEARLDAFLASIKRQTIPVEVVAVDDGSTDKTFTKLSESHLLSATRNPGNIGITRSMNRLFEIARSFSPDYLTWCGVDEELYPDGVERRLRYLEANDSEIVITGADAQTPTRKIRYPEVLPQYARLRKADFSKLYEELLSGNFFQSPILVDMNKVSFDDLFLDERTRHFPDWDQYLTLSRKYKIGFMDESTGCSDWDGENFSTPNPALYPEKLREFVYVLSKHLAATRHTHSTAFTFRIIITAITRLAGYYSRLARTALSNSFKSTPAATYSPGRV